MTCATCCVKGVGFVVVCFDVEEKVTMLLLVLGHGTKMRVLHGTYKQSLETISRLFSAVLSAIISLSGRSSNFLILQSNP